MQPKAQSAMEYLITYGWAILIIAIVLAAFFGLGVFNSNTYSPKAPPGSCSVYRPEGSGSTRYLGTEGVCSGAEPEYVAYFKGGGPGSAYSSNSYITANASAMAGANVPFTLTMWVYTSSSAQNNNMDIFGMQSYQAFELFRCGFGTYNCQLGLHRCTSADTWAYISPIMSLNRWYFVAVAVDDPNYYFQLNGNSTTDTNSNGYNNNANLVIGAQTEQCDGEAFAGYISNVQIYNSALSANQIQQLYAEGIGGVPVVLSSLVGWWPLNGNTNDYSGNNHNGNAINVTFVGNWENGYSAPS